MTNARLLRTTLACAALAGATLAGCASSRGAADDDGAAGGQGGGMHALTAAERRDGWRHLFDGRSTDAWRGYREQAMPAGWQVIDGALTKSAPTNDIVTREEFGDFDLRFDWKLGRGGNAGVFYRASEEYDKVYWSATEYQLLDDPNARDGQSPLTSAGAAYGFYPAPRGVVKPADEWNSSRIVVRGQRVEHWLNGQKIVEYEYGSPDWEAKYQASKFKGYPSYGRVARGRIGIQGDHAGLLALRDVRIRELR